MIPDRLMTGAIQDLIHGRPTHDNVELNAVLLPRYRSVITELSEIGATASNYGFTFSLSLEPSLDFHFQWDTQHPGVWITFSKDGHPHSTLLGFPLNGMTTTAYGPYFFGGEPPAARLLRVTDSLMLFVSDSNSPPKDILEALSTPVSRESPPIPEAITRQRGPLLEVEVGDPVCVDCPASPGRDEVLEISFNDLEEILLVGIVTSGYPMKEFVAKHEWK